MVEKCILYVVQYTSDGQFGHNKVKVTTFNKATHLVLVPKFLVTYTTTVSKLYYLRAFKIGMSTYMCGM
jgi:hypothetical protein